MEPDEAHECIVWSRKSESHVRGYGESGEGKGWFKISGNGSLAKQCCPGR